MSMFFLVPFRKNSNLKDRNFFNRRKFVSLATLLFSIVHWQWNSCCRYRKTECVQCPQEFSTTLISYHLLSFLYYFWNDSLATTDSIRRRENRDETNLRRVRFLNSLWKIRKVLKMEIQRIFLSESIKIKKKNTLTLEKKNYGFTSSSERAVLIVQVGSYDKFLSE